MMFTRGRAMNIPFTDKQSMLLHGSYQRTMGVWNCEIHHDGHTTNGLWTTFQAGEISLLAGKELALARGNC